ncbi:MAG: ADP-ribosylglycohydrolase family protein [Chitinispirillaceae bacterium]|nr:ADP-ribosylglycohydrolase family protein [Chitinispirillaceae bacterium]
MKRTAFYSEDKISGLMFGMLAGDALGFRFNDKGPDEIPPLDMEYIRAHPPKNYTDDSQMAISVLEEMTENGLIDQSSLRDRFLRRFSPWRSYGGGMLEVIERWRDGEAIESTAASLYNGSGNFGDGAAVRVAPIPLFFQLDETAALQKEVDRCVLLTHTHPYGRAGALLHATAILLALNDVPENDWITRIFKLPIESAFKIKLGRVAQCLDRKASANESAKEIGNGPQAIEAVPAALFSVLRHPDSFLDAFLFSISMGGDTDTIGAMTGALAGARMGAARIPDELLEQIENEKEGLDFIRDLIIQAKGKK